MRFKLLLVFFLVSILCQAQHVKTYHLSKNKELTIGATCLVLGITDQVLSKNLKPLQATEILSLDANDLPSFDRSSTRQNSTKAKELSDVFEYSVFFIPVPLLLSNKIREEAKEVGVMYLEAFSLNLFSTQFVKFVSHRTRPFMYNESIPIAAKQTVNGRKSFYSGHVSHTATLSIFTAKVFSDFYPESKWKPAVWATAFAIPMTTGYLRYKAGQHFPSDIVVGLAAGSLIGYFVPELHRLKLSIPEDLSLNSTHNGLSLVYTF